MNILGIHAIGHDTGAAIVTDRSGSLEVVSMTEARLTRINHASTYPLLSIQYCLDALQLSLEDIHQVCADDLWMRRRRMAGGGQFMGWEAKASWSASERAFFDYLQEFGRLVEGAARIEPTFVHHMDAHAASSYYMSPFDEAAVLCMDAGSAIYRAQGLALSVIDRMGYTGDLVHNAETIDREFGLLNEHGVVLNTAYMYDAVTEQLGYTPFEAGKTMALAAYGSATEHAPSRFSKERFIDFLIFHGAAIARMNDEIPRADPSIFEDPRSDAAAPWIALAADAQRALEEDVLHLASLAKEKTGARNLCLAGGTALSCVANRRLIDEGIFDEVFVVPAASDEGIALGCALRGYYQSGGRARRRSGDPYLGRDPDPTEAPVLLSQLGVNFREASFSEVAGLLADGQIVARVAGPSEWGPRALGARSILASPQRSEMRDFLNAEVKHREAFRPFGPSCLADHAQDYFDLPAETPYMVVAAQASGPHAWDIPAAVHVDGSSRPQTVRADQNPGYHALIAAFGELTGCNVLVNTSFNDSGEPICEDYLDAMKTFSSTSIDHLFLDDRWLVSADQKSERLFHRVGRLQAERIERSYARAVRTLCHEEQAASVLEGIERLRALQGTL